MNYQLNKQRKIMKTFTILLEHSSWGDLHPGGWLTLKRNNKIYACKRFANWDEQQELTENLRLQGEQEGATHFKMVVG